MVDAARHQHRSVALLVPPMQRHRIRATALPSENLDPRLASALNLLWHSHFTIPDLAARVGLSAPRLRTLARAQVGMPLTRWRAWAQLRRAAEALQAGRSPAEAAITAGFADQPHFTRRLREMMGITPAAVRPLLCPQSRRAT